MSAHVYLYTTIGFLYYLTNVFLSYLANTDIRFFGRPWSNFDIDKFLSIRSYPIIKLLSLRNIAKLLSLLTYRGRVPAR